MFKILLLLKWLLKQVPKEELLKTEPYTNLMANNCLGIKVHNFHKSQQMAIGNWKPHAKNNIQASSHQMHLLY